MTSKSLAVELKNWRTAERLTLLQAQERTNIHRNTLQRYEHREGGIPKAENIIRLAKVLKMDLETVLRLAMYDKELNTKKKDQ
ncbi:hypothetical protein WOSG25_090150 [Weissella oryzae SG25]|uniref:HTH cro/C1-type domain-containing protein n=1 Tax=Weissella oryzae (strain DSM 25784 / JCM 18191 / LMG 30913 / SG25) TaxID=1329250 RepID=A0A069CVU4_WEIOS|nr:helix-turn-helix transcriptional regulator [Weissella oryzae]GAK31318.1 hypothetical protein WOSG25_090150 [Weissella oryzae SG25]